jgi:hypothetical protein
MILEDKYIINALSKGSNKKIKVKCDVCGNEKMLSYRKYTKNIENGDFYGCSVKCSYSKNKSGNINNLCVTKRCINSSKK